VLDSVSMESREASVASVVGVASVSMERRRDCADLVAALDYVFTTRTSIDAQNVNISNRELFFPSNNDSRDAEQDIIVNEPSLGPIIELDQESTYVNCDSYQSSELTMSRSEDLEGREFGALEMLSIAALMEMGQ
jgi:hypothetical protein